jgi:hypothetical protein
MYKPNESAAVGTSRTGLCIQGSNYTDISYALSTKKRGIMTVRQAPKFLLTFSQNQRMTSPAFILATLMAKIKIA